MEARPSLLTAVKAQSHVHLIVGATPLAATRCAQSLAVGAVPILIAPEPPAAATGAAEDALHYGLRRRIEAGEVRWIRRPVEDADLFSLGRKEVDGAVDAVFVTLGPRDATAQRLSSLCARHRIPVNVADSAALSTFSVLSTHVDGPLQVGVTTNGMGCKLASRLRREVAASLPAGMGAACARLGALRRRVRAEDEGRAAAAEEKRPPTTTADNDDDADDDADDSVDQGARFNRLVVGPEAETAAAAAAAADARLEERKRRRIRWLAQVCEYWPLRRLASADDDELEAVLDAYSAAGPTVDPSASAPFLPVDEADAAASLQPPGAPTTTTAPPKPGGGGTLILAGAGPGHPSLLTHATYLALQRADLVLADKLVPAAVLELVPRRTEVRIARKFPGNADRAQEELMALAREAVARGETVVRLKQGDPYVFGRGGEEVLEFREEEAEKGGQTPTPTRVQVLPGLSSALVAPLLAGIPGTMRGVADQVLLCTGTGRKGQPPDPPEYVPSRTAVFLMALHRVSGLVAELTAPTAAELAAEKEGTDGAEPTTTTTTTAHRCRRRLWPLETPCAVVERASCADQRVVRTTLARVAAAVEAEGSRPPGLLVVGRACEALVPAASARPGGGGGGGGGKGEGRDWTVEEGFRGFDGLFDGAGGSEGGWGMWSPRETGDKSNAA